MTLDSEQPFALHQGRLIKRGNLWADVRLLAERLPDRPYVFNLCQNRYLFCLMLLAAASRGQVCLLPPSSKKAVIREIALAYPGAYLASENSPALPELHWFEVIAPGSEALALEPELDWARRTLVAFSSGSTGKPVPCPHRLNTFKLSAEMAVASLGLARKKRLVLSTTPPQHMYGLETSIFWPLFSELILHDAHPFFPADIRYLVETAPWPTVLATTPTHLRSLTNANDSWPNLAGVISATDVLSEKLARQSLAAFGLAPQEIYGSTETLSFASRQPLRESLWRPYPGIRLIQDEVGQTRLESPHLPEATPLQDNFSIEPDGHFMALGRQLDMVKIGGKRTSLSELNRRLKDIDGVEDGFCFIQDHQSDESRLTVVVVSSLDRQSIREGLRPYVDEVFLPRKIHCVAAIPRNETGKLTQTDMAKLLAELV